MQKTYYAVLLLVLYSTLASGQRQHRETDRNSDGLAGKVKSIAIKEYAPADDASLKENLLESIVKQYDERGYLSEIKEFSPSETVIQRQVFTYVKKGNRREEMLYDEEGVLLEKTVMKLNSAGNPVQSVVSNASGNAVQKNTYLYDEKDRLLKQNGYDAKGKLSEKSYYIYNEKGLLFQYLSFNEFENKKILYKYDANKNPVEMTVYDSKTNAFLEKIVQKFDEKKNVVETNYLDEKNGLKSSTRCKYDEKGNTVEYMTLDAAKNITDVYTFSYQYDNQGNWVMQTAYKGKDKQMESRTERIIEYYE